jgi:hypothetical protein
MFYGLVERFYQMEKCPGGAVREFSRARGQARLLTAGIANSRELRIEMTLAV